MRSTKWTIVVLLSLTLLAINPFVSFAQSSTDKRALAKAYHKKANDLARKQEYREAVKNFTAAITLFPNYMEYYRLRAEVNMLARDYKAAIADFDRLIQKCPSTKNEAEDTLDYFKRKTLEEENLTGGCEDPKYVYHLRGIAKERLGNKLGACNDFREADNYPSKKFEADCIALISSKTENTNSSSSINLGGVIWETTPIVVPASITGDTDGSVTTAKRYYYFDKQGKVTAITVFSKSGGVDLKLVPDLVDLGDGLGLRYRDRYKYVPTSPDSSSIELSGTYTVKGNTLTFEIPGYYSVNALIYADLIGGTLTDKDGNKSKWIITKRQSKNE